MKLKFKTRLAFFNTIAAAASTLFVFIAIYTGVRHSTYRHIDGDIEKEKEEVFRNLRVENDQIHVLPVAEWEESEHKQLDINPTFIQVIDINDKVIFQSANLSGKLLTVQKYVQNSLAFDTEFEGMKIREGQFNIINQQNIVTGYLTIGISLSEARLMLGDLEMTLILAFPFLLLVFFGVTSFAAARGIAPIHSIISIARGIDDQHLSTRLPLPSRRDEIYGLVTTINDLLERIEESLKREQQLTADLAHEMRTPLTSIRGTLEVLLRRKRTPETYEMKLKLVLQQTDRLNQLFEQILQLARLDAGYFSIVTESVKIYQLTKSIIDKWKPYIDIKQADISINIPPQTSISADSGLMEAILSNLLSNSLKYGGLGVRIWIEWDEVKRQLRFFDDGPGISSSQIPYIFDRFYRGDSARNAHGSGLGLAIVKKMSELHGFGLQVTCPDKKGVLFVITIPKHKEESLVC